MNNIAGISIQSTAGAVPVRNDKGEVSMQKVKVHRYVSGKRPDYAPMSSSEEESEEDDFIEQKRRLLAGRPVSPAEAVEQDVEATGEVDLDDPRLRRLKTRKEGDHGEESEDENRMERHRHIHAPEILDVGVSDEEKEVRRIARMDESEEEEEEDELSDEEIERRRQMLREKVLNHKEDEEVEVLDKEEEGHSPDESASESSEYEEYSDSEEEAGPRLKPVFVRKKDRVTVMEKEREAVRQKQAEIEAKKMAEERRKYTLKMVEEDIRKETSVKDGDEPSLHDVNTDDENDEVEYEAWKLRELKRIKRDREEREQIERERLEIERLRNMTEEERRQELRNNPKFVTNKATKGKYKFLQKYYHRGAFFMNQDDDLYKRDFSAATLEDHFDKTILPKVMQVKNFGRSGRTKYTHLVDQDTTQFDSPWISETAQNLKFHNNQAAGMKQVFERPSVKRSK
ncbi:Microfibrillar-associated protein 1 [Cryptotermes secundus]|uniref:Microfibrillar-associated protein 1 n=2 Tax=Cryptotermes secundus TaxID=105785 RepID=A0A2J7PPS1_9NEOP|nr:microfibrillar-associated protein 1 [Cryptotermes secundus]PNF18325.1 Microfibrillar-associated protein 1 [Cryptotermes secundus]